MAGLVPTRTRIFSPTVTDINGKKTTLTVIATIGNSAPIANVVETVTSTKSNAAGTSKTEYLSLVTAINSSSSASPSSSASSSSTLATSTSIHAAAVSPSPDTSTNSGGTNPTVRNALVGTFVPLAVIGFVLAWLLIRHRRRRNGIGSQSSKNGGAARKRRKYHDYYMRIRGKARDSDVWDSVRRGSEKERAFHGYDDEKQVVERKSEAAELPA